MEINVEDFWNTTVEGKIEFTNDKGEEIKVDSFSFASPCFEKVIQKCNICCNKKHVSEVGTFHIPRFEKGSLNRDEFLILTICSCCFSKYKFLFTFVECLDCFYNSSCMECCHNLCEFVVIDEQTKIKFDCFCDDNIILNLKGGEVGYLTLKYIIANNKMKTSNK
jgi:hypothetical protein